MKYVDLGIRYSSGGMDKYFEDVLAAQRNNVVGFTEGQIDGFRLASRLRVGVLNILISEKDKEAR